MNSYFNYINDFIYSLKQITSLKNGESDNLNSNNLDYSSYYVCTNGSTDVETGTITLPSVEIVKRSETLAKMVCNCEFPSESTITSKNGLNLEVFIAPSLHSATNIGYDFISELISHLNNVCIEMTKGLGELFYESNDTYQKNPDINFLLVNSSGDICSAYQYYDAETDEFNENESLRLARGNLYQILQTAYEGKFIWNFKNNIDNIINFCIQLNNEYIQTKNLPNNAYVIPCSAGSTSSSDSSSDTNLTVTHGENLVDNFWCGSDGNNFANLDRLKNYVYEQIGYGNGNTKLCGFGSLFSRIKPITLIMKSLITPFQEYISFGNKIIDSFSKISTSENQALGDIYKDLYHNGAYNIIPSYGRSSSSKLNECFKMIEQAVEVRKNSNNYSASSDILYRDSNLKKIYSYFVLKKEFNFSWTFYSDTEKTTMIQWWIPSSSSEDIPTISNNLPISENYSGQKISSNFFDASDRVLKYVTDFRSGFESYL